MTEESYSPLKMLKRAQKRKKTVMDAPPGPNRNADLHWLEQDTKAMLTLDNTEAALKLIEEKISSKTVREIMIKEAGEKLEAGRKRRIPFDRPGQIPAI